MSYQIDQNGDIVISGWEKGIAPSPHSGLASLKNVNISTETGEVMASFKRTKQTQTGTSGSLTQVNTNTVSISGITLLVGQVITIVNAGTTGLSGNYYYISTGKLVSGSVVPSDPTTATIVTGISSGTATFSITNVMGVPIDSATESYYDTSNAQQYRYFILDNSNNIWCHDTSTMGGGLDTPVWFLVRSGVGSNTVSGLNVFYGWLTFCIGSTIYWKSTVLLGSSASGLSAFSLTDNDVSHPIYVGNQGKMYVGDGRTMASVFPSTSLVSGLTNVQSFGQWVPNSATVGNLTNILGGSVPFLGGSSTARIPAVFFSSGTKPTSITVGTIYWIAQTGGSDLFEVYDAQTGGAAKDVSAGVVGKQYFNTFYPVSNAGQTMITFTAQRVNLPFNETVQCMTELGNAIIIGGKRNVLYPWDQVGPLPGDLIYLPESNTKHLLTVNNVAYVFTGNKGNIYITNGSSVSPVIKVPDYTAGIAGTPASYIEPYFVWGGFMYCRGRVYFSVLDQTATKTGNCGGIWSFVPNQNFFSEQDVGMSLRIENQNSYGTYNGYATVLLENQTQSSIGPQYWSGWTSAISAATNGIDYSDTTSVTTYTIESDLIPTGTMLKKKSFAQLEYKMSTPLVTGESVAAYYRLNSTDAWTTCGSPNTETSNVSGYFTVPFQNTQWVQLQVIVTTAGDATSSFGRLKDVRLI